MLKYILLLFLITNCKSKVIYKYDYCEIKEIHLQNESKVFEPRQTKLDIVFNNRLRGECQ